MSRNEKTFQAEFNKSFQMLFKDTPYYYSKIRDDGYIQMYDAHLWYYPKGYIGIEYKMNKSKTTINMNHLFLDREHQIRNLQQRINLGFRGWVLINWFIPNKINTCFLISPFTAQKYIDKGTVKMTEFIADKEVIEIPRDKHNGLHFWNFEKINKNLNII